MKPLDTLIPKQEVCRRLGVGPREVERLTAQGRLSKQVVRNGTGKGDVLYELASVQLELDHRNGKPGILPAASHATSHANLPVRLHEQPPEIPLYAYMSVAEAAAHIRMSEEFIRAQIRSGRLPAHRGVHGGYRVKRCDVEKV